MKKIILSCFIVLIVFLIYLTTIDKKVYYLDLSVQNNQYSSDIKSYLKLKDKLELYESGFTKVDDRITDLIRNINDNIENNKNKSLKNALIKADLITLSIGENELNYNLSLKDREEKYDYAITLLDDLENLFLIIRKYCKEDIVFIGFDEIEKQYHEYYNFVKKRIINMTKRYNIQYLDNDEYTSKNILKFIDKKILD